MRSIFVLLLLTYAFADLPPQNPIVGIYTQDPDDFGQTKQEGQTYIAASYIKNLEMAGAQVVPLFYHYSHQQLSALLSQLNGVIFPGGQMPIDYRNQWTNNIDFIIEFAKKQNEQGRPFPIWATCLGYQAVMYVTSGQQDNTTVFTNVKGQLGLRGNLTIINNNSPLIRSLSSQQYSQITNGQGLFWFHHYRAVTLQTYNSLTPLQTFWKVISTSVTQDNVVFLSTVEARDYPFFMTQYHPQKNSFEWKVDAARTYNAISVEMKYISEFVKVARLSPNRMDETEWKEKWIYNYSPFYSLNTSDFTQVYFFDQSSL